MKQVTITVDAGAELGTLDRIWRSFGYDEINWTYTPIGQEIFRQIRQLPDGPYWIRNHNAFTSGDRISRPAWGSTNCYTEGQDGKVHYDWSINDRVYDTFLENGCKPMIELGFMPHDLSSHPEVGPEESWRYPPRDYDRWQELNFKFAQHLIDRYGKEEVRTWYFAPWNEPDISYFKWKPDENLNDPEQQRQRDEEFFKLYDYAGAGLLAADDKLCFGGPELAGRLDFLERFLTHCHDGINYVTGERGTRLDFISLHCKGTGIRRKGWRRVLHKLKEIIFSDYDGSEVKKGYVPNPDFDLIARRAFLQYYSVIRKFPGFENLPLIGNEWDIDVGTTLGTRNSPDFVFRNNSYYPTFVIRAMKELLDLKRSYGLNIQLVTQWAFYFYGKPCFAGHRAIFDPMGIRKPLFNGFEMLARLGGIRLAAATDDQETDIAPGESVGQRKHYRPRNEKEAEKIPETQQVKPYPRVDALAAREGNEIQIIVWNQVCNQYATGSRSVQVLIKGLEGWSRARLTHYRIDEQHSNAHSVWQRLGCPDWPTQAQIASMKKQERLEKYAPDVELEVVKGIVELAFELPVHSVSMLILRKES